MGQLADMLRSEGGLPYKEAIASTIITIIEDNPEAKEKGETFRLLESLFDYNPFIFKNDLILCFILFGILTHHPESQYHAKQLI